MKIIFESRISVLLSIIVWPSVLVPYIFFIKQIVINNNKDYILPFIIFSIVIVLLGFIWSGVRYVIDNNKLVIKIRWIKYGRFDITEISKISRSYCILSAPANSLKRLKCEFNRGSRFPFILISPMNEDEFIRMLLETNPSIEIDLKNNKRVIILDWDF
jgi:hypothetical protein